MDLGKTMNAGVTAVIALFAMTIVLGASIYGGATLDDLTDDKLSATSQWNSSVNSDIPTTSGVFSDVWGLVFLGLVLGVLLAIVGMFYKNKIMGND